MWSYAGMTKGHLLRSNGAVGNVHQRGANPRVDGGAVDNYMAPPSNFSMRATRSRRCDGVIFALASSRFDWFRSFCAL